MDIQCDTAVDRFGHRVDAREATPETKKCLDVLGFTADFSSCFISAFNCW